MSDNQWDAAGYLDDKIAKLRAENDALRHRVEALRESGDGLWYCLRHIKMVSPADRQEYIDEWVDTRDNLK